MGYLATVYLPLSSLANRPQGSRRSGGPVLRSAQVLVDGLDGDRARPHGGGHPLDRPVPDVARGEDPGHAGLEHEGRPLERPRSLPVPREVGPRNDVAALVTLDLAGQPARVGIGSYEDEEGGGVDGLGGPRGGVLEDQAFEPSTPATVHDAGVQADLDVLGGLELRDQVL